MRPLFDNSRRRPAVLTLLIALLAGLAGCSSAPRTRLGALPCPGTFTLYELADPSNLGPARYESTPRFGEVDECERGIIYTRRAGFLDLAHLRETMDWSWYASRKVAKALQTRQPSVAFEGYDGCLFTLTFNYPHDWDTLSLSEKQHIEAQLSRKIGELVAYHAMTWHEIITWFGYRTTLIIPEDGSSFTYEDTMSHLVGIYAADDALRNSTGNWDKDATHSLKKQLDHLGVVSQDEASDIVHLVKNQWWKDGVCIKRNLDLGRDAGGIQPWLVRGAPGSRLADSPAEFFPLPSLSNIAGKDYTGFWRMTIKPTLLIPDEVKTVSSAAHHNIDPDVHFPILMDRIRKEMKHKFGPMVDRPYNDWPVKNPVLITDRSLD